MAQQTRLKDIAETAGCSIAVVSCVVNGSRGNISCNPELRERILRIARDLHYTPHFASKALRSHRTNTLGVCVGTGALSAEGLSRILAGIWDACRERKYDVLCLGADAQGCAMALAERRIDALVFPALPDRDGWAAPFVRGNPCCVATAPVGDAPLDSVTADDAVAAALAVQTLVGKGHRRIGFLDAPHRSENSPTGRRRQGFESEMARNGLAADIPWMVRTDVPDAVDGIVSAVDRFARSPVAERPTAFVASTPILAVRFLRELANRGIDCPRDVGIVCIGDAEESAPLFPTLSMVGIPYREIGGAAARHALDRFEAMMGPESLSHVSPGPLPTARLQVGRRGRRPTVVVNALAEESSIRFQNMLRTEDAPRERIHRTLAPTFIDRGSISTLSE